jgi:hypothetical protein
MIHKKDLLLMIALLCVAGLARASGGKNDLPLLHGYVTDALTKRPVQGVVVSAFQSGNTSAQEVTTDSEGYFHFGQLPSTPINLQFEKKGYQSYKRSGITVKEKTSIKLIVEFLPEEESDVDDSQYPLLRMLEFD